MKSWRKCWLALAMFVLTVLGAQAVMAAETGTTADGFAWMYEEGTMAITGYEGTAAVVNIPSSINGKVVTRIHDNAFEAKDFITKISIPNSVTAIGRWAFRDCRGLISIRIPNSVTSIGSSAFWCCIGLTSIVIPNSVTIIENYAFFGCSGLTSVIIPDSVTSIDYDAFHGCSGLTSITIPNSVTSIGYESFYECRNLKSVTFSKLVPNLKYTKLGYYSNAFGDEKIVSEITIYGYFGTNAEVYAKEAGITFIGTQSSISEIANVDVDKGEYRYTEMEIKPAVSVYYQEHDIYESLGNLIEGKDYTISYRNNINPGTATVTVTGINHYKDTIEKTFEIRKARLYVTVKLSKEKFSYTGKEIKPGVTVILDSDKRTLKEGTDYIVSYANNKNVGTARVIVTGINNYEGIVTASFKISAPLEENVTVKLSKTELIYNGKTQKPKLTVVDGKKKLTAYSYSVTWPKSVNPGEYTVTVKLQNGYKGTKKAKYTIIPKGTTLGKLKGGKKQLTVKWESQPKQITGYEISYSTDKDFKNEKLLTVKGTKKTSAKIKKLKKKKAYYVRIRTYKMVGKKKLVSSWSKAKKMKIKK